MKIDTPALSWVLALCVAWVAAGCGRATDRCPVSGAVTLDGRPVDGGNIQINPIDAKQASASGAMILAGRYAIPRDTGLSPGKYLVRIYWAEKIDASNLPSAATPGPRRTVKMPEELIPAKYNTGSGLTIEVRQGESNKFDFALTTKPSAQQ